MVFCVAVNAEEISRDTAFTPVVIDYFYQSGCADCAEINNRILPEIKERFEGFCVLNKYDVGEHSNVVRLVAYQNKLGVRESHPVLMVVDYSYVLNGYSSIEKNIFRVLDESIAEHMEEGWRMPDPIVKKEFHNDIVRDRFREFTFPAVILGGLLDGINPCAIGTMIFFMSLLAVAGVGGRGFLLMGVSFCCASFIVYTILGLGLLHALYLLEGFEHVRNLVEIIVIVILGLLAGLSFRDGIKYKQSGNAGTILLQLPARLKKMIHNIMRSGVRNGGIVIGGIVVGALVTLLESVCTGQVYIPTLVFVIKTDTETGRAWQYLLLYNAMFILPLAVIFMVAYFGTNSRVLVEWSRKHVVSSKFLMGCFFAFLAVLMILMRQ